MANATAITINDLDANGELADPTPDVLDTGTSAVTLPCSAGGKTDRLIFRVKNTAAQELVVSVLAGDTPPAQRAGLGAFAATGLAQNAIAYLGPFESGRFGQDDGKINLLFTPASGTIGAEVTALRLPKV
jgi:hypothetical protein